MATGHSGPATSLAWQCPMVELLGATELFGRPFKALTWNIGNCLFFDEVIRNNLTRSDPTCAPVSGGTKETLTWRHEPSHQWSTEPAFTGSPTGALLNPEYPWGLGQGRGAGPCGRRRKGKCPLENSRTETSPPPLSPPLLRQHTPILCRSRYGLEVAAPCAKGAWVHPPTLNQGRDTLLQKAFLPKRYPK